MSLHLELQLKSELSSLRKTYADNGVLFHRFCENCVDVVHVNTIKEHLNSKSILLLRKAKLTSAGSSRQVTLTTVVKAKGYV